MVRSKIVLMVLSIIVLIMGILALIDVGGKSFVEPSWHAILKIIVALIALIFGYMDKG